MDVTNEAHTLGGGAASAPVRYRRGHAATNLKRMADKQWLGTDSHCLISESTEKRAK